MNATSFEDLKGLDDNLHNSLMEISLQEPQIVNNDKEPKIPSEETIDRYMDDCFEKIGVLIKDLLEERIDIISCCNKIFSLTDVPQEANRESIKEFEEIKQICIGVSKITSLYKMHDLALDIFDKPFESETGDRPEPSDGDLYNKIWVLLDYNVGVLYDVEVAIINLCTSIVVDFKYPLEECLE